MMPELQMDWLIELTSEQLYGPTTLGAIQEFLNLSEINAETMLINARDGSATAVKEIEFLTIPVEEPEELDTTDQPVRTGIRASLAAAYPRTGVHAFRGAPHARSPGGEIQQTGSEVRGDR